MCWMKQGFQQCIPHWHFASNWNTKISLHDYVVRPTDQLTLHHRKKNRHGYGEYQEDDILLLITSSLLIYRIKTLVQISSLNMVNPMKFHVRFSNKIYKACGLCKNHILYGAWRMNKSSSSFDLQILDRESKPDRNASNDTSIPAVEYFVRAG